MAKNFKSGLPKVISQANKDISTIIENDIAKESALLKDLVDQVLKANLEVKKKNNMRITETKRKLAQLDEEIESLNVKIDLVDRETVIQQLNEMIDAENKIFNARQEIRFFDNEQLPTRIDTLNDIYQELTASVETMNEQEEIYRKTLLESNVLLFSKQLEVTNEITKLMDETFTKKQENLQTEIVNLYSVRSQIIEKEQQLSDRLNESIEQYQALILESSSTFSEVDDDEEMAVKLEQEHQDNLKNIEEKREKIEEDHTLKQEKLLFDFNEYEESVKVKFESSNKAVLDQERELEEAKAEKLKQIRLSIMNAEKQGNINQIQSLMKEFDKVEKQSVTKVSSKVRKDTNEVTKKQRNKTNEKLRNNELKYATALHNLEYESAFETIRFEEAKILYKIMGDNKGLQTDVSINKKRVENLKSFLVDRQTLLKEIGELKLSLRLEELLIMKENEYSELDLIEAFKSLLTTIKVIERKRNSILKLNTNQHELIQIDQHYRLMKSIEDVKLDQETNDIDKLILRKRNETLIRNEKLKEELNSEVIYQESLIKIAQKEHELQLIKVQSLYENERSLAEEQVERINLGVQVNDTFVKTTLQNQLLFASQQINCAESEYDIRVESVHLTHDQEIQYANKKIEYYRQKFDYDKSKYRKELEDKLEDLNFKLLLFTDDKDHKEISSKIQELKDYYEGKVDEIEDVENNDEEILRYEKVIKDADRRAEQAISEAEAIRDETISSFTKLYDMTKEKYDLIQETDQTEDTKAIIPLLNNTAVSSADKRLQQAIKEADLLFAERIAKPKAIIEETNAKILELTNSDETHKFIEEQKELKKEKLRLHKEVTDQLLVEKNEKMAPYIEENLILESTKETEIIDDSLDVENADYRKRADIDADYQGLSNKEKAIFAKHLADIAAENKMKLQKYEGILKETNKMIKSTFKPYKTYIKKASKDITRKKKTLKKQFDRKLKKHLNETEKRIKENILI